MITKTRPTIPTMTDPNLPPPRNRPRTNLTMVTEGGIPIRNTLLTAIKLSPATSPDSDAHTHGAPRICNNVTLYRIASRMPQQQLAEAVGVTRQTISRIESCRQEPLASLAIAIAEALGASVEQLFHPDFRTQEAEHDDWRSVRRSFERTNGITPERHNAQLSIC